VDVILSEAKDPLNALVEAFLEQHAPLRVLPLLSQKHSGSFVASLLRMTHTHYAPRSTLHAPRQSPRRPDPDLVEVRQQVGGILIDPIRARSFELVATVSSGQDADAKGGRAAGGE